MKIGDIVIDVKYGRKVIVDEIILEASKRIEGRWICEDCKLEPTEPKKTVKKEVKKVKKKETKETETK